MNNQKILKSLRSGHFTKIANKGEWFEDGSVIYAKEIKDNIYLLFVILKDSERENVQALIAQFEDFNSIGKQEPKQIMFYLSIKDNKDLHYFEKYLAVASNP